MKEIKLKIIGDNIIITGIILTIILLFDISMYVLIILFGIGILLSYSIGIVHLMRHQKSQHYSENNINKLSTSLNAALKQLNNNQLKLHQDITTMSQKIDNISNKLTKLEYIINRLK